MSPLDYRIGTDDGTNEADSIEPVLNGQDANEDTFQRPTEHIRTRTENIRKSYNLLEALAPSDLGFQVVSSPDARLHWTSSGTFSIDDGAGGIQDAYLIPLLSTADVTTPPGDPVRATYYYNDGGGAEFVLVAKNTIYAHNGGNNLYIYMHTGTGSLSVSIVGDSGGGTYPEDGPVIIDVELASGGSTLNDVVAAIESAAAAYLDTAASQVISGGTTNVNPVAIIPFYLGDSGSKSAVDAVGIKIGGGAGDGLAQFFGGATLSEGDALVIDFTDIHDRLSNTLSDTITSAMFKIINDGSQNLASNGIVPIAKVMDGDLYFINGCVYEADAPAPLFPGLKDNALAAAISDTPRSLSAGTVHSQMTDMLAHYNAHVDGTQDDHSVTDITGRPYVTVGASGADYSNPAAAISALTGSDTDPGGNIYVNPGTYTVSAITPLGRCAGVVHVMGGTDPAGSNPAQIEFTSGYYTFGAMTGNETYIFENLKIKVAAAASDILIPFIVRASSGNARNIVFRNCVFVCESATWGTGASDVAFIYTQEPTTIESCSFDGGSCVGSSFKTSAVIWGGDLTDTAIIQNCYPVNLTQFVRVGHATYGASVCGLLSISDNTIGDMGDYSGTDDYRTLIGMYTGSPKSARFDIKNNHVLSSTNYTTFCNLRGQGTVSGNTINRSPTAGGSTSAQAIIKVETSAATNNFTVENNAIIAEIKVEFGIETAGGNCTVHNNTIPLFTGYGATTAAISITDGGAARNNTVVATTSPVAAAIGIRADGDGNVDIASNHITSDTSNFDYGIYVELASGDALISGNNVVGTGGTNDGIYVDADKIRVIGNKVDNFLHGIKTASTGCPGTIANNSILVGDVTSSIGIHAAASQQDVTGNIVSGGSSTANSSVGILVDKSHCVVANNHITGWETGVETDANADYCTVSGNRIQAVINCIDVDGEYSSVTGNSINATLNGSVGVLINGNGSYSAVSGNSISGARTGVHIISTSCVVSGNDIKFLHDSSPAASYGVRVGVVDAQALIAGNRILGDDGASTYGVRIDVNSSGSTVASNNISAVIVGIEIDEIGCVVTGNYVSQTVASCTGIKINPSSAAVYCSITSNMVRTTSGTTDFGIYWGTKTDIAVSGNMVIGYNALYGAANSNVGVGPWPGSYPGAGYVVTEVNW